MQESQLQAYLNKELSLQECEEVEALLRENQALRERLDGLREQDRMLLSKLQMLQKAPPLSVKAALARFHQRCGEKVAEEVVLPHASEKSARETTSLEGSKRSWTMALLGWMRWRFPVWAGAFACVALLVQSGIFWKEGLDATHQIQPPKRPSLRPKGALEPRSILEKDVVLQVGYIRDKGRMKRLGDGDTCRSSDTLGFAFTLQKSGYPYLFLQEEEKVHLLYPLDPEDTVAWRAGHHQLMLDQEMLLYRLARHRRTVRLVLLKTEKPLSKSERSHLLKPHIAPLFQREAWRVLLAKRPQSMDHMKLWVQP